MNSTWLPLASAIISGSFVIAGVGLGGTQARRRERRELDARRAERRYDVRSEIYTNLVLQLDAFLGAVDQAQGPGGLVTALAGLHRAAVPVAFQSREIAAVQLNDVLGIAERLAGPLARSAASSPDRVGAMADLAAARAALLDAFSKDLDRLL
ncbi:hypothetical protein E1263_12920 [Kribbella antibiotica]|uniref:Uncharacterized protein n=1 Tax=Kribbella antibiotica TaxID=190195 RepID=A0A4R4ZPP7_9ACTN|nr:hypothetical protein [Kribbella antibiotica]TDD59994.1 hypothetical protein E1263_12920 [Kribbella antibiotica]